MILINLVVDGKDLGDSNLMNSSKRTKTYKKYSETENHLKRCLMAKWIRCLLCNLKVMCSILHL